MCNQQTYAQYVSENQRFGDSQNIIYNELHRLRQKELELMNPELKFTVDSFGKLFTNNAALKTIVEQIYDKPLHEIKPPEGYKFTGELASADGNNAYLASGGKEARRNPIYEHRLILEYIKKFVGYNIRLLNRRPENKEYYIIEGEQNISRIYFRDHGDNPTKNWIAVSVEDIYE